VCNLDRLPLTGVATAIVELKKRKVMSEYEKQAMDFAEKYGVKLKVLSYEYKVVESFEDNKKRYVFKCRLTRNKKVYTFEFGQSIANGSKKPAMYDVLACVTKYEPDTLESFCREFGYDSLPIYEYPRIKKIYLAVCREYKAICRLFPEPEVMEELCEIS